MKQFLLAFLFAVSAIAQTPVFDGVKLRGSGTTTLTGSNGVLKVGGTALKNGAFTDTADMPVSIAQGTAIGLVSGASLQKASNLSDLPSAASARNNLGIGSVNNTSDPNKPVSTAQQAALDLKQNAATAVTTGTGSGQALPGTYLTASPTANDHTSVMDSAAVQTAIATAPATGGLVTTSTGNVIQFKYGTLAQAQTVTPALGEPVWVTDSSKLFIGDGTTAGGIAVSGIASVTIPNSTSSPWLTLLSTPNNTDLFCYNMLSGTASALNRSTAILKSGSFQIPLFDASYSSTVYLPTFQAGKSLITIPTRTSGTGTVSANTPVSSWSMNPPILYFGCTDGSGASSGTAGYGALGTPILGVIRLGNGGGASSTGNAGNGTYWIASSTVGVIELACGSGGSSSGAGNGGPAGGAFETSNFPTQSILKITYGNGGAASSLGDGGQGGSVGKAGTNGSLIGFLGGNGGAGGTASGASGGAGGAAGITISKTPILIAGGNGGTGGTSTGAFGGSGGAVTAASTRLMSFIGGTGGNGGAFTGGAGGFVTNALNFTSGNGGNGSGSSGGGTGGNIGSLNLNGGNGSTSGGNGGNAGSFSANGSNASDGVNGNNGGSVNLNGGSSGAGASVDFSNGQGAITYSNSAVETFLAVTGTTGVRVAVPANSASTGVGGEWASDDTYFYFYGATGWRRISGSSF